MLVSVISVGAFSGQLSKRVILAMTSPARCQLPDPIGFNFSYAALHPYIVVAAGGAVSASLESRPRLQHSTEQHHFLVN